MRYVFSHIIVLYFSIFGILAQTISLVPFPSEMKQGVGVFTLTSAVKIVLKNDSTEIKKICDSFLDLINPSAGKNIGYDSVSEFPVFVELNPEIAHPEGYYLKVTPKDITIQAQTPAGIFYAF